jgi:hypothetical protein
MIFPLYFSTSAAQRGPFQRLGDPAFSLRGVGQIRSAIGGDQRQIIFVQQRAHPAVRFHGFNLAAEEFGSVVPEVANGTFYASRSAMGFIMGAVPRGELPEESR